MKVFWRVVTGVGNTLIETKIRAEIGAALKAIRTRRTKFVVNDTLWYWQNPAGNVMPCVANSASFITKTFQDYLENKLEWKIPQQASN
jgi:hypothetical protein